MKILFLSIAFPSAPDRNLYSDLVDTLIERGHEVTIVSSGDETGLKKNQKFRHLSISIPNLFSNNKIKKGLSNLRVNNIFYKLIIKNFKHENFDLVMYATPPVTLAPTIKKIKGIFHAKTFLMLKDIFPQNAVDLDMFSKKSLLYKYFRNRELELYTISDIIGCMSKGNISYLKSSTDNRFDEKIKFFPNTIADKKTVHLDKNMIEKYRLKYGLPVHSILFVFGGNLGKPQGISDLLKGIGLCREIDSVHFVIVGSGTEADRVLNASKELPNLTFIPRVSSKEFDSLLNVSDVGIISLNKKFTIPNYPSRTLSYLQAGIPILASTDKVTDIKQLIKDSNNGRWSYSGDQSMFIENILWFVKHRLELKLLGNNGRNYFKKHLLVDSSVDKIEKYFKEKAVNEN